MKTAGRSRRPRLIQEYLDGLQKTFKEVAQEAGVSGALVSRTAQGKANNRRVLRRFIELGVDPALLDLPEGFLKETKTGA